MKESIHPQWFPEAQVRCACGQSFTTGSTVPEIKTEICHKCHPFFTGKEKLIDTEGVVEKFEKRRNLAQKKMAEKKAVDQTKKDSQKKEYRPRTLKEMLDYAAKPSKNS